MRLQERPALLFFPKISAMRRSLLAMVLSFALVFSLGVDVSATAAMPATAKDKKPKQDPSLKGLPISELSPDEAILHALNRLAYGPRPGDVERIRQMGLAKWIEEQQAEKRLADAAAETIAQEMRAGQGRAAAGSDVEAPQQNGESAPAKQETNDTPAPMKMAQPRGNLAANGGGARNALGGGDPNTVPRAIADDSKRPQRIVAELGMAKVTRAIYSERQLQQVLDDFWFNHFNVFAGKGEDRYYLTSYERDVIQPHALGKFKDLVTATAKSPAMLFYLDNFMSADPRAAQRQAAERAVRQQRRRGGFGWPPRPTANPQQTAKKNERGLNENYGRELMELHTLGVDGGYTQKDVTEVARCFTGWTIDKPRQYADFKFDDKLHDPDPKIVLGKKIHAGGMKDGEQVIDLLAHHPSTAKFISTKLARRFVSDNPPPTLVDRMARTFQKSDGDIREVLHTMIYSPEFWSRESYHAKIKTPFELVVSAVRALGTDVDTPMPLVQWIGRIGEPLYQCQPPTGYSDKADAWVNTRALLNRLNYSLALAGNKMRGARTDVPSLLGLDSSADPKTALDRAVQVFLGGQAGPTTVETLEKQLDNPQVLQAKLDDPRKQVDLGVVAGLVLGAPEFQRR